jgi:hypothetical protein
MRMYFVPYLCFKGNSKNIYYSVKLFCMKNARLTLGLPSFGIIDLLLDSIYHFTHSRKPCRTNSMHLEL